MPDLKNLETEESKNGDTEITKADVTAAVVETAVVAQDAKETATVALSTADATETKIDSFDERMNALNARFDSLDNSIKELHDKIDERLKEENKTDSEKVVDTVGEVLPEIEVKPETVEVEKPTVSKRKRFFI